MHSTWTVGGTLLKHAVFHNQMLHVSGDKGWAFITYATYAADTTLYIMMQKHADTQQYWDDYNHLNPGDAAPADP